ncbi:MAG: hypothetical protein ACOYIH_06695 [Candidatus Fimadaptatus sp.]|jgi:major membrane immunogen (membrane-anchored lipoprotein)
MIRRLAALLLMLCMAALSGCFGEPSPTPTATPETTGIAGQYAADPQTALADGAYFAASDGYSDGWKDFVSFTVEGGRIVNASWDCLPLSGTQLKSTLAAQGKYVMKQGGKPWNEQAREFADELVRSQGLAGGLQAGNADALAGVSISVSEASRLFERAKAQGALPRGELQDGLYCAQAQQYGSDGFRESVSAYISGGRIVWVNWNADRQDGGKSKKELGEEYGMKANSKIGAEWDAQAMAFERYVLEHQGVDGLSTDKDGKTDAISGCTMSVSGAAALMGQILEQARAAM